MYKTETEAFHPYNHFNSMEEISLLPGHIFGYFPLLKIVHYLHLKLVSPGFLQCLLFSRINARRVVICSSLQTLDIALLWICLSHYPWLPCHSKIIFCAFVFNPWENYLWEMNCSKCLEYINWVKTSQRMVYIVWSYLFKKLYMYIKCINQRFNNGLTNHF